MNLTNVYEEFQRIDYLFSNAGIAMYGELYDMSIDEWKDIVDINLWGIVYGTQVGYQIMKNKDCVHLLFLRHTQPPGMLL